MSAAGTGGGGAGLRAWTVAHARSVGRSGNPAAKGTTSSDGANVPVHADFVRHAGSVLALATGTLPDGRPILASGGKESWVRIHDLTTGDVVATLSDQHKAQVRALVFGPGSDPGDEVLCSADAEGVLLEWQFVASGIRQGPTAVGDLASHVEGIQAMARSSFGLLAIGVKDGLVIDPESGRSWQAHSGGVRGLAFYREDEWHEVLVSAGNDQTVRTWSPETGRQRRVLVHHRSWVTSLAVTDLPGRGTVIASGDGSGSLSLVDTEGREIAPLRPHVGWVRALCFTVLGQVPVLVSSGSDNDIMIHNALTGALIKKIQDPGWPHPADALAVATLADGRVLLVGGAPTGQIRAWVLAGAAARPAPAAAAPVVTGAAGFEAGVPIVAVAATRASSVHAGRDMVTEPQGRLFPQTVALAPDERGDPVTVATWQNGTGWELAAMRRGRPTRYHELDVVSSPMLAAAPLRGTAIALALDGDWDGSILTLDLTDPTPGWSFDPADEPPAQATALTLANGSGDRPRLVVGGRGGVLAVFDGPMFAQTWVRAGVHGSPILTVAYQAMTDGADLIATGGTDGAVRVTNAENGELVANLRGHRGPVSAVAMAVLPDGRPVVASGGIDGDIRISYARTGGIRHTVNDGAPIHDLAMVTVGATPLLISCGENPGGEVWDPGSGQHLVQLDGSSSLYSVAALAAPDGTVTVVAGGVTRQVLEWKLAVTGARPAAEQEFDEAEPVNVRLRACAVGLSVLSEYDLNPPLSLLADLVTLTGGGRVADPALAPIAESQGLARLRDLHWSTPGRVGLAALLLADLPADPAFVPPAGGTAERLETLLAALWSGPAPHQAPPVPYPALAAAAHGVDEQLLSLLAVLGENAVAADPTLAVRLRHRASAFPELGRRQRLLLAEMVRHPRRNSRSRAGLRVYSPTTDGISRRGRLPHLLPTQLALPREPFAIRYARQELLYRLHEDDADPVLPSVTIVLDTTPATFGPVETVLRTAGHVVATTLWESGRAPMLVCLDRPEHAVSLDEPTDLTALWTTRTLRPPDLARALATATAQRPPVTALLTQHHLIRDQQVVPGPQLRVLSAYLPADPPPRGTAGRYHAHLGPHPSSEELAAAVAVLLAPVA
ncbi:hypothetical protein ACTOB_003074 [Actinoplanes oblitus]|uniref:Anaphase-promoting complex subunit 4 WD40 domain-containing protein n=1 Tax=Actinoplanes oblitus TaxID=3040509 RepID=A0ABY8WQQ8_9ACTN|nr:hypothetical protein [Actinoplanes oblitus]WIM99423.1 hypothetical protein ACTOB_003074 [Actinoplanes oblitus]